MRCATDRRVFIVKGLAAAGTFALASTPSRALALAKPAVRSAARGIHLGLVTYMVGAKMDLPALIKVCEETGIEGLELRTTHKHGVEPSLDAEARSSVRKRFAETKVRLVALGSTCEFHSTSQETVRKNIETAKQFAQLAADLGAWGVKVRPNGLPKEAPEDATLRQIGTAVHECAEFAKDKGIAVFVECHGSGTSHPPHMAKIMEYCDHPNACLCWNCNGNDVQNGSIREYFDCCKPWIRHVHIHTLDRGYPYNELFDLLKAAKFTGYTMIETTCDGDPSEFLRGQRAMWEKLAL